MTAKNRQINRLDKAKVEDSSTGDPMGDWLEAHPKRTFRARRDIYDQLRVRCIEEQIDVEDVLNALVELAVTDDSVGRRAFSAAEVFAARRDEARRQSRGR